MHPGGGNRTKQQQDGKDWVLSDYEVRDAPTCIGMRLVENVIATSV